MEKSTKFGMSLFIVDKDCPFRYAWVTSKWLEKSESYAEEIDETCRSRRTNIIYLITCAWDALNVNGNRSKMLLTSAENVRITNLFLLEQLKNCQGVRHFTPKLSHGPTTWKVMLKKSVGRYCELVSERQSSCTKSQLKAWKIIISRRRNWNQLENCQKYAHMLSCNACTWHVGNTVQQCRFQDSDVADNYVKSSMFSLKSNSCSHKLDVQRANISVSQFHRRKISFCGCWFTTDSLLSVCGLS